MSSDRTIRPLVIVAAFATSLAVGLLVMMWLVGGFRGTAPAAGVGGPFRLTDQAGQVVTEKTFRVAQR